MYKVTKKNQQPFFVTAFALILALSATSTLSATSKTAEIKVKADYMAFDLETGRNIYEGNVSITQGSIELTGDKVTILRSNDKVSDIDVSGKPARYIQDENTQNIVRAMSQKIHYSAQQSRLTLIDEASLEQSDHTVESQRIVYDTSKKIIIAGNDSSDKNGSKQNNTKQRVNITLTPKKDSHKIEQ